MRGLRDHESDQQKRARTMQAKLERLGVEAKEAEVVTPLEILGEVVAQRWGPSRVLAIGGTSLQVDGSGNYLAETAWDDSGGGISRCCPS